MEHMMEEASVSLRNGDVDGRTHVYDRSREPGRLRKMTSDGGNMAARARHQALMKDMEAMPNSPVRSEVR